MKNERIKKYISAILCIALLLCSLASCSSGPEEKDSKYKSYHVKENRAGSFNVSKELKLEAYLFALEDGSAVLELKKPRSQKIIQSVSLPISNEYYSYLDFEFAFDNIDFVDINFDGYADIYLPCSVTTANLQGMAWLWNSEKCSFVLSKELSVLPELMVFADEKLITSQDHSDPSGILCKEFKWENGKLIQTSEYTISN